MTQPIKVLVVDDSALIRQLLSDLLERDPGITVVGTAQDPFVARRKIKALAPDVLTLDVEMPRMDGLTFLRNLMRLRPMPVVMVSSLTAKGAEVTLEALELGVVDFVTKPQADIAHQLESYGEEICNKVRVAAGARIRGCTRPSPRAAASGGSAHTDTESDSTTPRLDADAVIPRRASRHLPTTDKILAIGASTGGTEAIRDVLLGLPPDCPGVVIAQHIPPGFSAAFAERMNRTTPLVVKEAEDGDRIRPGHAFVAPGNSHLLVRRSGAHYHCQLNDGPPVNRHRPSVDVLFRSLAQSAGPNVAAALLTGMGADGTAGLGELREQGALTIAQNEATSLVWGMPGEAVKRDAAMRVLALDDVADALRTAFGVQVSPAAGR